MLQCLTDFRVSKVHSTGNCAAHELAVQYGWGVLQESVPPCVEEIVLKDCKLTCNINTLWSAHQMLEKVTAKV
jgi:hypothetical protein